MIVCMSSTIVSQFLYIAHWKYSRQVFDGNCFPHFKSLHLWASQIEEEKKTSKKNFVDTIVNNHNTGVGEQRWEPKRREENYSHTENKIDNKKFVRRSWTIAHDWICKLFLQSHKNITRASRRQQLCEYTHINFSALHVAWIQCVS